MPPDVAGPLGLIGAGTAADALRRRLAAAGLPVRTPDDRPPDDADVSRAAIRTLAASSAALVTLLPAEARLRATLEACAAARALPVLDLSPVTPGAQHALDAAFRAAGVALFGGRILARFADGVPRETLYVDEAAMRAPALRSVLAALAADVVATGGAGRAKALGLIDDLLAGVNAAAVGEALALGRRAGLEASMLMALLQKGSGATALIAHPDADDAGPVARRDALARVIGAAQQSDHSLWFGSVAVGSLTTQALP